MFHPGRRNGAAEAGVGEYPYYNENVGLFALLYTPKLWLRFKQDRDNQYGYRIKLDFSVQDKLIYALNPAADIDKPNTKIYGLVEFDFYLPYNDTPETKRNNSSNYINIDQIVYDFFSPEKGFAIVHKDKIDFATLKARLALEGVNFNNPHSAYVKDGKLNYLSTTNYTKYTVQSYILPIDKLHEYQFGVEFDHVNNSNHEFLRYFFSHINLDGSALSGQWNTDAMSEQSVFKRKFVTVMNPRIKVESIYNYLPNNYEVPSQFKQIFTYSYDNGVYLPKQTIIGKVYPQIIRTSQITFTSTNNVITAHNIIVDSDISNFPFPIYLNGFSTVIIEPGGTTSTAVFSQIIQDPLGHVSIAPVNENVLKTFCGGNEYKAKKFVNKSFSSNVPNESKSDFLTNLTLHPNPSTSLTTLTIENPSAEQASVRVYDLVGREVYSQDMRDVSESNNTLEISTNGWNTGIYIVKVIHGEVEKSIKLEVR